MESALIVSNGKDLEITSDDVRKLICPKATPKEIGLFLQLCKSRNLNPFIREVYLIKYGPDNPASMVVGKDLFTKVAANHPQYDGIEAGIILETTDGKIEERMGSFYQKDKETLIGGWAKAYRKDQSHPTYNTVSLDEYMGKTREGKPTKTWKLIPATMIRKVALVQSLREAFPDELGGLYDAAEINTVTQPLDEKVIDVHTSKVIDVQTSITMKEVEACDNVQELREMYARAQDDSVRKFINEKGCRLAKAQAGKIKTIPLDSVKVAEPKKVDTTNLEEKKVDDIEFSFEDGIVDRETLKECPPVIATSESVGSDVMAAIEECA